MKKILYIVVAFLLFGIIYKLVLLNKYHVDEVNYNTTGIFKETITVNHQETPINEFTYEDIIIKDDFSNYEYNGYFYIKKNENNNVDAAFSINKSDEYYMTLCDENLNDENDKTILFNEEDRKKFVQENNIKSDIDLLKYIKEHYYLKSSIFNSIKTLKNNYIINSFVSSIPISEDENYTTTLINGDVTGYINNINVQTKEIHILHDNKQYIIVLLGKEFTNNDYVISLLKSIKFK